MGILNVTPDSFYAGSRLPEPGLVQERAGLMLAEGADILDVGGYSTRPGAADISPQQEADRVLPAIEAIRAAFPQIVVSVDTFRANVARQAVAVGAHMVNDVSGGQLDPAMFDTISRLQVPYILMHMRGTPQNMANLTQYEDVFLETFDFFQHKLKHLHDLGCKDIIVDPGFGFAKNMDQNYTLLRRLAEFKWLGRPVLAGVSRKSMVYKKLGITPEEALNGTTVLNTVALQHGTDLLRVHDVKAAREIIELLVN
jgi:dihydropteroate synthase